MFSIGIHWLTRANINVVSFSGRCRVHSSRLHGFENSLQSGDTGRRVSQDLVKAALQAPYKPESSHGRNFSDLHLIPVTIHNLRDIFQVTEINNTEIS